MTPDLGDLTLSIGLHGHAHTGGISLHKHTHVLIDKTEFLKVISRIP